MSRAMSRTTSTAGVRSLGWLARPQLGTSWARGESTTSLKCATKLESLVQLVLQYDPVSDESPGVTRSGVAPTRAPLRPAEYRRVTPFALAVGMHACGIGDNGETR